MEVKKKNGSKEDLDVGEVGITVHPTETNNGAAESKMFSSFHSSSPVITFEYVSP